MEQDTYIPEGKALQVNGTASTKAKLQGDIGESLD